MALTNPESYASLAEGVEAWGFRLMQERGTVLSREEVAEAWFRDEYLPAVTMLPETTLLGDHSVGAAAHQQQHARADVGRKSFLIWAGRPM